MLPAYIIEELRRREEARRELDQQPTLELPLPMKRPAHRPVDDAPRDERGVTIISIFG